MFSAQNLDLQDFYHLRLGYTWFKRQHFKQSVELGL
jgi:hypothetical protein